MILEPKVFGRAFLTQTHEAEDLVFVSTEAGGANFRGSVFEITPGGKLKTMYSFCSQTNCADGDTPLYGVVQASDGTLYGTTYSGGNLSCSTPIGCGVIFSLT